MSQRVRAAFAFVSDIHGNHVAFEAVLDDVQQMRSSSACETFEIVCLGDSFDGGPDPVRVFAALKDLGCVHLRGNHEDYLFDCLMNPEAEKYRRPLWRFVPWTILQMGESLLEAKKFSVERWSCAAWKLNAVHAGQTNNNRVPDFFTQQSQLTSKFVSEHRVSGSVDIFFNGHSHYLGRHQNPLSGDVWFNCGSVGYPFVEKSAQAPDAPLATWVWVECFEDGEVRIENRRVAYSSDTLLRRYVESGALESCAPFSFAIAAQSLFNTDVVYPFFQAVKKQNLTPEETALVMVRELEHQMIFERINRLLRRSGLKEVKCVF